jgi:hypothetical protein
MLAKIINSIVYNAITIIFKVISKEISKNNLLPVFSNERPLIKTLLRL